MKQGENVEATMKKAMEKSENVETAIVINVEVTTKMKKPDDLPPSPPSLAAAVNVEATKMKKAMTKGENIEAPIMKAMNVEATMMKKLNRLRPETTSRP